MSTIRSTLLTSIHHICFASDHRFVWFLLLLLRVRGGANEKMVGVRDTTATNATTTTKCNDAVSISKAKEGPPPPPSSSPQLVDSSIGEAWFRAHLGILKEEMSHDYGCRHANM